MNLLSEPGSANTNLKKRKKERNVCVICRLFPTRQFDITDTKSKISRRNVAGKPTGCCRGVSLASLHHIQAAKPRGRWWLWLALISNVRIAPKGFCQEARQRTDHSIKFQGVPVQPGGPNQHTGSPGGIEERKTRSDFFILSDFVSVVLYFSVNKHTIL